jgi:hypothetical protein
MLKTRDDNAKYPYMLGVRVHSSMAKRLTEMAQAELGSESGVLRRLAHERLMQIDSNYN